MFVFRIPLDLDVYETPGSRIGTFSLVCMHQSHVFYE